MKHIRCTSTLLVTALMLGACGGGDKGAPSAAASEAAPSAVASDAGSAAPEGESGLGPLDSTETVQKIENCVLETPKGMFDGPCERVEWGGPSFSIRLPGGKAFLDGITEVVVEVDRLGEKAGGSYRRGPEGDLIPTGPLTFRDDCACWVRSDFRVGAFNYPE